MDGFDEEEIARAIALSMQETAVRSGDKQKSSNMEVIEIPSSDEEDEEVKIQDDMYRAVHASQAASAISESSGVQESRRVSSCQASGNNLASSSTTTSATATGSSSAFPFDRAQLERERLARLKRLRPDIVETQSTAQPEEEGEDELDERDIKRQRVSYSSSARSRSDVASSSTSTTGVSVRTIASRTQSRGPESDLFWDGELRQTANKHVEPAKDTRPVFTLTDILSPKDEISFAILSSYCNDYPWIYSFFNPNTPVIIVAQDPEGNETMKEILPNWIRTTPFLRGGRGCMHMKFLLLFYKTGRLRVVVTTANLVPYDWRDIENTAWVQDFPLRPEPIPHDSKATDFATAWARTLRALNVAPALITMEKNGHTNLPINRLEGLRRKWDFSKVEVQLVPSIAGKHEGWPNVIQSGHTALMKGIRDVGARTPKGKTLILECQGSSIGTYSTQWMNEFYCSARGDSAEEWLDQPKARRAKLPYPPVKIVFPSVKTVGESILGEPGGGTMFCRRTQWEGARFPRELFHDSKSKRGRVLMHSKMVIGYFQDTNLTPKGKAPRSDSETEPESDKIIEVDAKGREQAKVIGWAYVGSHNFTPSAWGTLSGSAFNPILNNTNYELGIVFPLHSKEELDRVACWERPPRKYVAQQDKPWMQSESAYFVGD